ncbi:MAG: hypothetical protein QF524_05470, partial [Planctomycetota bacterium]|nr:hypothetical protein [Planctomycetota bacterium]
KRLALQTAMFTTVSRAGLGQQGHQKMRHGGKQGHQKMRRGPEFEEQTTGSAEVLALFKSSRWGSVAGCSVLEGVFRNSSHAHVIRDGKTLFSGKLASLRHLKDDVKEVKAGMECGLRVEEYDGVEVGDTIQAYDLIEVAPQLDLSEEKEEGSIG